MEYIIRREYKFYLWNDKLKALGLACAAWIVFSFTSYAIFVGVFFILLIGTSLEWEVFFGTYLGIFVAGGFLTLGFGEFVARGMFDWIEDWYIVKSSYQQILPYEQVKVKGKGHWWAIFKWGYDRSDRIRVFDGFEGRRYYYARNREGWRYDNDRPRWQYPQVR